MGFRREGFCTERASEVPDLEVNFLMVSIGTAFRSERFAAGDALVLLLDRVNRLGVDVQGSLKEREYYLE